MIPASYRVGWAARGAIDKGPLALTFVGIAFGFAGVLTAAALRGPRSGLACAGLVVASMVAVDLPAPSQRSWSEFELKLPLAFRDLVRARLVLAVAVWLAPVLMALGLGAVGLIPAPTGGAAVIAALSAMSSIVLAAVAREVLGLSQRWGRDGVLVRVTALLIGAIGFVAPAAWLAPAMLVAALAWWRSALIRAPAAFELQPRRGQDHASRAPSHEATPPATAGAVEVGNERALGRQAESGARQQQSGAVGALLLRHTFGSTFPVVLLVCTVFWPFLVQLADPALTYGPPHVFFVLLYPAYHAAWSSRVLRLEPLPVDRARLFRYVAWPALMAFALGSAVAMAIPPSQPLAQLNGCCEQVTLQSSKGYWRFASGDVPVVAAPDGETHQPEGRRFGLGSWVVAYDPYEAGAQSSHAFQVHQLRRLLREQYGVVLSTEEVEARTAVGSGNPGRQVGSDDFPELRGPLKRASAARFTLLALGVLLTLCIVIHPGHARSLGPRRATRGALRLALLILLLIILSFLPRVFSSFEVDAAWMLAHALVSSLADHLAVALPLAAAFAAVLYRTLQHRFRRMEAPLRAEVMDDWFMEV